jgi:hypothetical protein
MPRNVASSHIGLLSVAIAFLLTAANCTQLPPTSSVAIPPIPTGKARLWFYRDYEPYETLARPYVRLNERVAGISEPGGTFYRDVVPVRYLVTVDSTRPRCQSVRAGRSCGRAGGLRQGVVSAKLACR